MAVTNDNIIQASHKTWLLYNLPPSEMDGDVVTSFGNSLIWVKTLQMQDASAYFILTEVE